MSDPESPDIFSERSPWALLRRYLGGGFATVLAYRDQMERRFPAEAALVEAEQKRGEVVEYTWMAIVAPQASMKGYHLLLTLLGHLSVSFSHQIVVIRTYHALPKGRFRTLWLRWLASKTLHALCLFVGILGGLALLCLGGVLILSFQNMATLAEDPGFRPFLATLAAWCLSIVGLIFEKTVALPPFARSIGRYPFALSSIKSIPLQAA